MLYFNLLVLNINFYVHFWLLLSKSEFQGLFEKTGTSTKSFGEGGDTDNPLAPSAPESM